MCGFIMPFLKLWRAKILSKAQCQRALIVTIYDYYRLLRAFLKPCYEWPCWGTLCKGRLGTSCALFGDELGYFVGGPPGTRVSESLLDARWEHRHAYWNGMLANWNDLPSLLANSDVVVDLWGCGCRPDCRTPVLSRRLVATPAWGTSSPSGSRRRTGATRDNTHCPISRVSK